MIPFLIATSLTCSEADGLIQKMRTYKVEEETRTEMIQIVKDEAPEDCWDANADWRNGLFTLPEDKPMAQVTYRGIKYDTDKRKQEICTKSQLTYRGVKFQKELCNA